MEASLKKDLSILTTISEPSLSKLSDKIDWCIANSVFEARAQDDDQVDIDLDFGTLTLKLAEDQVRYRFTPSPKLEKAIINVITNNQNILKLNVEKSLTERITKVYKDLF